VGAAAAVVQLNSLRQLKGPAWLSLVAMPSVQPCVVHPYDQLRNLVSYAVSNFLAQSATPW
jgi:hypothetical protein